MNKTFGVILVVLGLFGLARGGFTYTTREEGYRHRTDSRHTREDTRRSVASHGPALQEHAGHTVKFTGEMTGDTITVSKIAMPVKK